MELTLLTISLEYAVPETFNRTIMELKLPLFPVAGQGRLNAFNRTIMELKLPNCV